MQINDLRWDDSYKYVWYPDNGPWSTRFTAWYTAGLLHRGQGNDIANAKAALENMYVDIMFPIQLTWTNMLSAFNVK